MEKKMEIKEYTFDDTTSEEELFDTINKLYRNWLFDIIDDYSNDYAFLKETWVEICKSIDISPNKILVVDRIPADPKEEDFENIHKIYDFLSRRGYDIKRKEELKRCKNCGLALGSKELFKIIKQNEKIKGFNLENWKNTCRKCF